MTGGNFQHIPSGKPIRVLYNDGKDASKIIGRLAYQNNRAWFQYDNDWLKEGWNISPARMPFESGMLKSSEFSSHQGLHGVFADSLPDAWGRLLVNRRMLREGYDINAITPIERLAIVGNSGPGCFEFYPDFSANSDNIEYDLSTLDKAAIDALNETSIHDAGMAFNQIESAGGSTGGSRPKIHAWFNPRTNGVSSCPGAEKSWKQVIAKFRSPQDFQDIGRIEYAYTKLAQSCGINVPDCWLVEQDKKAWFIIDRFDRDINRKHHIISAAGLLDMDVINLGHVFDYSDLMNLTGYMTQRKSEVRKLLQLAIFNIVAHNLDDHAKQYSFIKTNTGWDLAPAYDLVYYPKPGNEHATSMNGKTQDINLNDVLQAAERAKLNKLDIDSAISGVEDGVRNFNTIATSSGLSQKRMEEIEGIIRKNLLTIKNRKS